MRQARRHRVLMVTSDYMPEVFGGAEQQCRKLSAALAARGLTVTVLTSAVTPGLAVTERDGGVDIVRLPCRHSPQQAGRYIASSLGWILRVLLWSWRRRGQFDVIHAHQAKINAVAAVAAAQLMRLPVIVKVGSAGDHKFDFFALERKKPLVGRYFARYVRDRADRVIAISRDLVSELSDYGVARERIAHIPNGVELNDIGAASAQRAERRAHLGLRDDELCLMFVGRLAFDKNLELLLDAFSIAQERSPRLGLAIVGDGEARDELEAHARRLGIAARVVFVGRTDRVAEYLAACDVFVLPARAEGMSNALLEAMSLARPAIASRVSGNVDLVEEECNGWLFDADSASQLAELMVQAAAHDPEKLAAMGLAGRQIVETRHGIAVIAERYMALYEALRPLAQPDANGRDSC